MTQGFPFLAEVSIHGTVCVGGWIGNGGDDMGGGLGGEDKEDDERMALNV